MASLDFLTALFQGADPARAAGDTMNVFDLLERGTERLADRLAAQPALRRALEARDRGCRFPGCGSRFTDAHHVIPWAAGGDTSLGNCVLLCKYHHRLVHEGGWTVDWWGEGRPAFYDPRGGVHCEVRWEAPELGEELVEALVEENRQRGVRPDAWELGARWKREDDISDRICFGAMEALG
jgi:hypothetical protein